MRKNYILIGIVATLTLIMGLTYAVFVISSDSYRASEMYIGNLLYGIEITNEDDTTDNINNLTVTLSPNEERTIKVKVNSLNPVDSKYKLQYTTSNNIEVKYTSDTPNPVVGDIEKENNPNDEVEIYIYLKNNENANVTITFGVKGGYNHNTSTSIELLPDYLAIIDEYTERDLILAITIDGEKVDNLPQSGYYELTSYECENSSVLEWQKHTREINIKNTNLPEKCNLNFDQSDGNLSFAYTGTFTESEDANYYYIKFLTSGTFKASNSFVADIFLVGGGAGGNGGGGGGGYTTTKLNGLLPSTEILITIGAGGVGGYNGLATLLHLWTANGGNISSGTQTANGGSGGGAAINNGTPSGAGGTNGGNGDSIYGGSSGGIGQGTTTRAFGEATGDLYSGGGGGCAGYANGIGGAGGTGGGGRGGDIYNSCVSGIANTGGGGGGGGTVNGCAGGSACGGGSGIAIIRWHK